MPFIPRKKSGKLQYCNFKNFLKVKPTRIIIILKIFVIRDSQRPTGLCLLTVPVLLVVLVVPRPNSIHIWSPFRKH